MASDQMAARMRAMQGPLPEDLALDIIEEWEAELGARAGYVLGHRVSRDASCRIPEDMVSLRFVSSGFQ